MAEIDPNIGVPLNVLRRGGVLSHDESDRFLQYLLDNNVIYDAHEVAASCLYWYQRVFKRWLIDWTQGTRVVPMKRLPETRL